MRQLQSRSNNIAITVLTNGKQNNPKKKETKILATTRIIIKLNVDRVTCKT